MPAYSIIFSVKGLFTHTETLLKLTKAYSDIFITLCNSRVFTILPYLEPEAYLKPCKTLSRHIQNPVIRHFSHIQACSEPGILGILKYSELFHNCIPTHIQNPVIFTKIFITLTYLKPVTYSESSQRFWMEFSPKIIKDYNYFPKALHLRSLTGFWIRPSFNKYSFTCRVIPRYVLYETYSEPYLLS